MQHRFETFTVLMASISRSIRKIKTQEMEEFNLKSTHVSCLYYLYREGELTATELCERCEEDKANISRAIDYLEKQGYIACRSNAQKRYRAPLVLTEQGRAAGERVAHKIDRILCDASEGVDEGEREIMYRSLAIISENLQKICDEYDDASQPKTVMRDADIKHSREE